MSFREYLRWEGGLAILGGTGLCLVGLAAGHQGPGSTVLSGSMMIAGTGVYMWIVHRASLRRPGEWFTAGPVAAASSGRGALPRGNLLGWVFAEAVGFAGLALGLSFLTGFWMTYADAGVWAAAIGFIKVGPASAALARHEAHADTTYLVNRRRRMGLVGLTTGSPPIGSDPARPRVAPPAAEPAPSRPTARAVCPGSPS